MAAQTYRYEWDGITVSQLARGLDPSVTPSAILPVPLPILDVTINPDSPTNKSDLDAVMFQAGFSFVSISPGPPVAPFLPSNETLITVTHAMSPYALIPVPGTVLEIDTSGGPVVVTTPNGMASGFAFGVKLTTDPSVNGFTLNAPPGATMGAEAPVGPLFPTPYTFAAAVLFNQAQQIGSSIYWRATTAGNNLELK